MELCPSRLINPNCSERMCLLLCHVWTSDSRVSEGFANNGFPVSYLTYGGFLNVDDPENPDYFNLFAFENITWQCYYAYTSSNCAPHTNLRLRKTKNSCYFNLLLEVSIGCIS